MSRPPENPPPVFSLAGMLREAGPVPKVRVVDVGAMALGDSEDIYGPLLRQGLCESVVGFEPVKEECEKANSMAAETIASRGLPPCTMRFLPHALGDGSTGEFRLCSAPMTSSMLEPNIPLLRRFVQLEEVTTVVQRSECQTKRLDDLLPELPGSSIDYLKLDVQGYELAVLSGSETALKDVLVVHTEVEFVEMYKGQPLFAEVDQFMRKQGFIFHRFLPISGRPMKPMHFQANPLQPISQQLWSDAVYVKDLWELEGLSGDQLLRMALILHEIYHAYDVVHHVLKKHDDGLAAKYLAQALQF